MATSNGIITMRRHDLDNLRSFLTGLVVVHHTAVEYGGVGGWPFLSRLLPVRAGFVSPPLVLFNAFNQSFFMGLFFFISGRVSAQSLERADDKGRGRWGFVKAKVMRLAVPTAVYTLVFMPALAALVLDDWSWGSVRECWARYFGSLRSARGPVWYTAVLFVFDAVAAVVKTNKAGESDKGETMALGKRWGVDYATLGRWGWVGVAAATFVTRLYRPVDGEKMMFLGLNLGHAPQYVFAYAMGCLSVSRDEQWLSGPASPGHSVDSQSHEKGGKQPRRIHQLGLGSATLVSLSSLPLCFLPSLLAGGPNWFSNALTSSAGGWNTSSLAYAAWNELSFALVGPALMECFFKWCNKPAASWLWQPRYSYAAFLLHGLVSVVTGMGIDWVLGAREGPDWIGSRSWEGLGPVVLTAFAGFVNVVLSFGIGRLVVDGVPGLGKFV